MSNIIRFPGMKPVNLDHVWTFNIDGRQIRFDPVQATQMSLYWNFETSADARRVYEEIQQHQTFRVNVPHMDGNYSD